MKPYVKVVITVLLAALALLMPAPLAAKTKAGRLAFKVSETSMPGPRRGSPDPVRAVWTWNQKKGRFFGRFSNGSVGLVRVQEWDQERVVLRRHDSKGTTAGLKARYEGARKGDLLEGTVTYTWKGQVTRGTWKAYRRAPPSSAVGQRPLNRFTFPRERKILLSAKERKSFPRLGTNFEVLAPRTKVYNCIAWSIGSNDRWEWPGNTMMAFDQLYALHGFHRIPTQDYGTVPGVQKIVLYGRVLKSGRLKCTHGARQEPDGSWTSKIGKLPLIRHLTPEDLIGPSYGQPIAVYVKSSPGPAATTMKR